MASSLTVGHVLFRGLLVLLCGTVSAKGRPAAPSNGLDVYVAATRGSDGNDCLSASAPCATVTKAVKIAYSYDHAPTFPRINLAPGSYTESVTVAGHLVGTHVLHIVGNVADPASVVWRCGAAGASCLFTRDFAIVGIMGVKFVGNDINQIALDATQQSVIDFYAIDFGDFPSGTHVLSSQSSVSCVGDYTISGGASVHANAVRLGVLNLNCPTVTIPKPITITHYGIASVLGFLNGPGPTRFVGKDNVTGQQYLSAYNAVLSLGGGTFPGNAPGQVMLGGVAQ
jgi:hypothetical protein